LSADVTLTVAAGVAEEELMQSTNVAPDSPASCSGIEVLLAAVEVPVSIVALRVWLSPAPTVSVQLTVTRWVVPLPVTVTVGLAHAR
jgi:hypothetical protein